MFFCYIKRVNDVIKTDQNVLDRTLSQTMGSTLDEPTESEENLVSESETESEFEINEEGGIVREEENKDRKRDPKTVKEETVSRP